VKDHRTAARSPPGVVTPGTAVVRRQPVVRPSHRHELFTPGLALRDAVCRIRSLSVESTSN